MSSIPQSALETARDPMYYLRDGNTTILVENTLFKVHRSMLTKDESTFSNMFSLDGCSQIDDDETVSSFLPEGGSDENPIHLHGDTTDEFRALMWSLYALPAELALAMTTAANELQLIHLARIAHKYQFKSTEAWSLDALVAYHARLTIHPSSVDLSLLTEVAVLCDCGRLLDAALVKWKRLIGEGRHLALVICVAERLNLRGLLGLAYHSMMLKGRNRWKSDPLTRTHRIRLLSGFYNLSQQCNDLPSNPPSLPHDATCILRYQCDSAWTSLWRAINSSKDEGIGSQVIEFQGPDLLGKVMLAESVIRALVQGSIPANGLLDGLHGKCLEIALMVAQEKVREVQEGLMDWFVDVE